MKRFLAGAVAAAATTTALITVLATGADADASHPPRTITFTFVQVPGSGFFPSGQPQPGSRFGAVQAVTGDDGSTGTGDVLCTFITERDRFCNIQVNLSTGQLALQGIAFDVNNNAPLTVIGGTGAYAAGRGSATVTDVNETTTRITVKLPT